MGTVPEGKVCSKCGEWKPASEYHRERRNRDGLYAHCRTCHYQATNGRRQQRATERNAAKPSTITVRGGIEGKVCARCNEWKPWSAFYADKSKSTGLSSYCRVCHDANGRAWKDRNPEQWQQNQDAYNAQFREKKRWASRIWGWINQDRKNRRMRAYNKTHKSNKHLRRARDKAAAGSFTHAEWIALCAWFGDICLCCGSGGPLVIDHVAAISRGGSNDISNLQPLCSSCNRRKHTRYIDYRDPALLRAFLDTLD